MMVSARTKYWVVTASKDHVKRGVAGGFAQACHGKAQPLNRMKKGDFVIYYSGKQTLGLQDKCQQFTAIGEVKDDEVYQFQMTADFVLHGEISSFFAVKMCLLFL